MYPKPRVTLCTRLLLVSTLFCLLAGCHHVRGVKRTWEVVTPIPNTGVADPDAPRRVIVDLEEETFREHGRFRGRVYQEAQGTEASQVELWRELNIVKYTLGDGILTRSITMPIFFALLGPFWGGSVPDYGGDGKVDAWDRTRFSLAMLNYFEALPGGHPRSTLEEKTGTEERRVPTVVQLGNVPSNLEVVVTSSAGEERIQLSAPDGTFDLDLEPTLSRLFGENMIAVLTEKKTGLFKGVDFFDSEVVADFLWARGKFTPDFNGKTEFSQEQVDFATNLFRTGAQHTQTPKPQALELYRRGFVLSGLQPRALDLSVPDESSSPTGLQGKKRNRGTVIDLGTAVDRGWIKASGRGRDLKSLSLSLTNYRDEPLDIVVLPGTLFDCLGKAQDMVCTGVTQVPLPAKGRRSVRLAVACANMHKPTPNGTHEFVVHTKSDPRLIQVAPYLHVLNFNTKQAVVWILTDDATLSTFARYTRPRIGRKEVLKALALLQYAGIDVEDRQIWKWVQDGK